MANSWKLNTIITQVKDIDEAVESYQSLGIGPFSPEHIIDRAKYTELKVSRPGDRTAKLKSTAAQVGAVLLEVSQPCEGDSFQQEFLDSKGQGVSHIGFDVEDIKAETVKIIEKGYPVVVSGERESYFMAIFDTRKIGGIYVELVQRKK